MKARPAPQQNASDEDIQAAVNQVHAVLSEQERRLIELLRQLPLAETPPGFIPYHTTIPTMAHVIMRMARRDLRFPSPSERDAAVEKITASLRRLAAVPIHYDREISDFEQILRGDLSVRLLGLQFEAAQLATEIDDAARCEAPEKAAPGVKPNEAAQAIVAYLAQEYQRLTGNIPKRPTERGRKPSGPFHTLVAEVFEILGIAASPANTIRSVLPSVKIAEKKHE